MATIPLKTCFEALRADDCFWIGESCTLRENMSELKIIERNSGNIVVVIVIDDSAQPPNQEIYIHYGSAKTLHSNWSQVWSQLWYKDRPRDRTRSHDERMRFKEAHHAKELDKYKDNEALPTIRELRTKKWEEKVKGMQEEGNKKGWGKGQNKNREHVWIPNKIPLRADPTYPYDMTFWHLGALEENRPEVFEALQYDG